MIGTTQENGKMSQKLQNEGHLIAEKFLQFSYFFQGEKGGSNPDIFYTFLSLLLSIFRRQSFIKILFKSAYHFQTMSTTTIINIPYSVNNFFLFFFFSFACRRLLLITSSCVLCHERKFHPRFRTTRGCQLRTAQFFEENDTTNC